MIDIRTDPEFMGILEACYTDTKLFCKTFFPEYFYRPFSSMHDIIFDAIDDDSKQMVAIAAPRGFGKSSLINMAYPAKHILYQDKKFIVPISATSEGAIEQSENLKDELLSNELIQQVFGKMEGWRWAEKHWITSSDIKIVPRGAGQQVRGRRHKTSRPDLIIVDDLEDDESVMSEDQRKKLWRWFLSSVVNTVDRGRKDWKIVVIGTVLHEDSLLRKLLRDPEWYSIRLDICDDQYNSNWPDYMPTETIKQMVGDAKARGELGVFYREFRNKATAPDDSGFRPEYFHDYTESEKELDENPEIESIVVADPSKTHTEGRANTGVMGISFNVKTGKIYIRDVVERQMFPNELYDEMIDMADRIHAHVLAPEVTGLNEYITYPLKNQISLRNKHFEIIEVKPRDKKASRAAALIPMYRQGLILHNSNCCGRLESLLMDYPRPEKWDIIDCLSSLVFVLEYGDRYFALREPTKEEIEQEYQDLLDESEDALVGWQRM